MHAMIESRWATGTYEMLLETGNAWIEGDVGITIFATSLTLDEADDEDAPILAQIDVSALTLDMDQEALAGLKTGLREIGEHGLKPEEIEAEFGPKLALQILTALYQAADTDMRGTDMEGRPWRQESAAAGPFRERVLDVLVALTIRLAGM
jgi:hypothetical protein